MPIYEYRCNQCNEEFEFIVITDHDAAVCPSCESFRVERMISLPSVYVRGTANPCFQRPAKALRDAD